MIYSVELLPNSWALHKRIAEPKLRVAPARTVFDLDLMVSGPASNVVSAPSSNHITQLVCPIEALDPSLRDVGGNVNIPHSQVYKVHEIYSTHIGSTVILILTGINHVLDGA